MFLHLESFFAKSEVILLQIKVLYFSTAVHNQKSQSQWCGDNENNINRVCPLLGSNRSEVLWSSGPVIFSGTFFILNLDNTVN